MGDRCGFCCLRFVVQVIPGDLAWIIHPQRIIGVGLVPITLTCQDTSQRCPYYQKDRLFFCVILISLMGEGDEEFVSAS